MNYLGAYAMSAFAKEGRGEASPLGSDEGHMLDHEVGHDSFSRGSRALRRKAADPRGGSRGPALCAESTVPQHRTDGVPCAVTEPRS